jgi:hypothetical protein
MPVEFYQYLCDAAKPWFTPFKLPWGHVVAGWGGATDVNGFVNESVRNGGNRIDTV